MLLVFYSARRNKWQKVYCSASLEGFSIANSHVSSVLMYAVLGIQYCINAYVHI